MPKRKFKTINEYIASFPKNLQTILEEVRQEIREVAPEAQEVISYQMAAFKQNGILVWFAAFKNHIGFFPKTQQLKFSKRNCPVIKQAKAQSNFQLMNQFHLT